MKKFLIPFIVMGILITFMVVMTQCRRGSVSVEGINISSVDKEIEAWAKSVSKPGIDFAKVESSSNTIYYYVLFNGKVVNSVNAKLVKSNKLAINASTQEDETKINTLVKITVVNAKVNSVILNGEEISGIKVLSD